jgi:hypothetical protein
MKRAPSEPVLVDELVALTYELLDAHRDTAELLARPAEDLRWRAHADYVRALQRKARELLALVPLKEGER